VWCLPSAYTIAFANWSVSLGVIVCSLIVFPPSHRNHNGGTDSSMWRP
jgi:hypothetical protein